MKNIIKKLIVLSFVLGFLALGSKVNASGPAMILSATATNITQTSATLNGVVNPNGASTNAWFKTPSSGQLQFQNVGSGTSPVTMIPYTLTGLTPNTTYSFSIVATNPNAVTNSSWVYFTTSGTPPPPPQYPTVNLSANPSDISYGASSTLSWNSTNATSCNATGGSNGWAGAKNLNGSQSSGSLFNTTTFNITCTGAGGSASDSVTVYVTQAPPPPQYPTVNLTASPTSVTYNSGSTLSWNSTNATSCNATGGSNGWAGPKNLNGSFYTGNLTSTTSYNITCNGAGGSASDSVTVYVNSAPPPPPAYPTVNLTANPTSVSYNGNSMLSWNSTNATSCNATGGSNGWAGAKTTNGTFYTGNLTTTTSYNITCNGAGGSAFDSVTVSVGSEPYNPPPLIPEVSLWANTNDLAYNGSTTLYWSTAYATSCTASSGTNGWAGSKGLNGSFFTGNLTQNTTYVLTCYNSSGSNSDSVTISVGNNNNNDNETPSVTTNPATNIDKDSATLRGTVDSNGGNVNAWFEWDTNTSFDNHTSHQYFGNTNGTDFSYNLTGLDNDQIYYFRAVAQNTNGQIVYGGTRTFTTNNDGNNCDTSSCDAPDVTTNAATNIDSNSATLRGEVDPNGSNARTWFEWGRSRSDLSEDTTKSSRSSRARSFSAEIDGLRAGTTYYFQAVAENDEGTDRGSIRSFTTDDNGGNGNNTCESGFCIPQAVTTLATNVGNTSARLNGLGIVNGTALTTGYFEWGTTQFLGATTGSSVIGSFGSNPYSFSLFGLASNTTYFYRAVVVNQYGTSRGDISTFRTLGGSVLGTNTTIVRNTTVVTNDNTGTSKPSLVLLTVDRDNEVVRVGEIVDYNIYYKNISAKNLRDVVLRVSIPKELQFMETTRGYFSEENNTVVVNVGDLSPGEDGNVVVTAKVVTNAEVGKVIVITANLVYTIVSNDTQEEVFAYSKNTIESGTVLGATALFGGGFLPNSLIGWLLLLLVILLIILAARAGYNNTRPQKVITYEEKHTTTS